MAQTVHQNFVFPLCNIMLKILDIPHNFWKFPGNFSEISIHPRGTPSHIPTLPITHYPHTHTHTTHTPPPNFNLHFLQSAKSLELRIFFLPDSYNIRMIIPDFIHDCTKIKTSRYRCMHIRMQECFSNCITIVSSVKFQHQNVLYNLKLYWYA